MRFISPLIIGSFAISILLVKYGFFTSGIVNRYEDEVLSRKVAASGCGPSSNRTDGAVNAKGDFQISTFLSDDELSKFKYESFIFQLGPGQSDTISHRHDCDVFVTVLEGTALIGQEFKKPDTVRTGEIFHERRNVIHSVTVNPSQETPMRALVVFIRKDGRAGYTPLYPKKKE